MQGKGGVDNLRRTISLIDQGLQELIRRVAQEEKSGEGGLVGMGLNGPGLERLRSGLRSPSQIDLRAWEGVMRALSRVARTVPEAKEFDVPVLLGSLRRFKQMSS